MSQRKFHSSEMLPAPTRSNAPTQRSTKTLWLMKFNGNQKELQGFLSQCKMLFQFCPEAYPTQRSHVPMMVSLFSGTALSWVSPLLEQEDPILEDLAEFIAAVRGIFCDEDEDHPAGPALQQSRQSVAEYTVKLRSLARGTTGSEATWCFHFWRGLNISIQEEFARMNLPSPLATLISSCILIDNRLTKRSKERKKEREHPKPFLLRRLEYEPRDGTQRDLTEAKKRHQRALAPCVYCSEEGHHAGICPYMKTLQETKPRNTLWGGWQEHGALSSHLVIPIQILLPQGKLVSVNALIDSGATCNFISWKFVQSCGIPYQEKAVPFEVELMDGKPLSSGPITQETCALVVLVVPGHLELVSYDIVTCPHFSVILGMPWLMKHDPTIVWSKRSFKLNSSHCQRICFQSAGNLGKETSQHNQHQKTHQPAQESTSLISCASRSSITRPVRYQILQEPTGTPI